MKWDLQSNSGNPKKSVILNEFIMRVKKHKGRREGKTSSARRAIELPEFLKIVKRCRKMPENYFGRYTGAAYFSQFHMITRLDDVEHFKCEDLTANMECSYTLKSKMIWSKNILEERENLDHIIIGSMDPNYCIITAS